MKVLHHLVALSLLCSSSLFSAEDTSKLDKYISKNKKDQFEADYRKNEAQSSILRDSWIAPLMINYSYSKSDPYDEKQTREDGAISMDQPIFQSGGIYYGIKFAQASKKYGDLSVDVLKRKLIKDAVMLLMQIKQMELKEARQKLQIKNSEISLAQKKENYLNGQLDSGFLNNAIIERNIVIQALYDIQTNKQRLLSQFKSISDSPPETLEIPHLKSIEKDQFISRNIVLNMSKSEIEKNGYNKNVTVSKYLPRVSIVAGYNWQKNKDQTFYAGSGSVTQETNYYNYGLKASIPIDINTFRDIEVAKVDYLKSKLLIEDKKRQLIATFEQVMQNIQNLDNKKQLSVENKDIYKELLAETSEQYNAGYKTKYDVELLQNSVHIQELDVEIYEIDKQLELLTLYETYIYE
jgi:outer membrane protein TolC